MAKGKRPVDNSEFFKHTEWPVRDAVYNKIVERYGKKGNPWKTSDTFVWSGAIYQVWDLALLLVFLWFVYWMAGVIYKSSGTFSAISFLAVMCLLRLNTLIRKVDHTNRILKNK